MTTHGLPDCWRFTCKAMKTRVDNMRSPHGKGPLPCIAGHGGLCSGDSPSMLRATFGQSGPHCLGLCAAAFGSSPRFQCSYTSPATYLHHPPVGRPAP